MRAWAWLFVALGVVGIVTEASTAWVMGNLILAAMHNVGADILKAIKERGNG